MKKRWIPALAAGVGGAILVLAAVALRGDAEEAPRPKRRASRDSKPVKERRERTEAPIARSPERALPRTSGEAPAGTIDLSVVRARVEAMEARLRELEARRDLLKTENENLTREITERSAQARARSTAEWRVRSWAKLLGLTESQKDELKQLWTRWALEDLSNPPSASTWLGRESELRSRLSSEQSLKLHDSTATQSSRKWSYMGRTLGRVAGAPKEDYDRLQQSIGEFSIPDITLLPEAHGADWKGMLNRAAERMRPVLTPDQAAKLDQYVGRYQ